MVSRFKSHSRVWSAHLCLCAVCPRRRTVRARAVLWPGLGCRTPDVGTPHLPLCLGIAFVSSETNSVMPFEHAYTRGFNEISNTKRKTAKANPPDSKRSLIIAGGASNSLGEPASCGWRTRRFLGAEWYLTWVPKNV